MKKKYYATNMGDDPDDPAYWVISYIDVFEVQMSLYKIESFGS